jgi:hypothetical protein
VNRFQGMAAEHIVLESDERDVPERRAARKVHAQLRFQSRLRRRGVELEILDYYYLSVRTWRAGKPEFEYMLDLRFMDPALQQSRQVAWRWMAATLAFAGVAAASAWQFGFPTAQWWQSAAFPTCAALVGLAVCTGTVSVYRSIETWTLHSIHGRARLLACAGGLGTLRSARPFLRKLVAHARIAATARRSSKEKHLRDEMREHFRLKVAGVLTNEEYEQSKDRILRQHPGRAKSRRRRPA